MSERLVFDGTPGHGPLGSATKVGATYRNTALQLQRVVRAEPYSLPNRDGSSCPMERIYVEQIEEDDDA